MRVPPLSTLLLLVATLGCGDNIAPINTIADHVRSEPSLSSLEEALIDAELLDTLDGPGPYTLFAFRDEAYDLNTISREERGQLVSYHIHEGGVDEAQLKRRTALSTIEGGDIHVRYGLDGILLNDGNLVLDESVVMENGVIHFLDSALTRTLATETMTFAGSSDVPLNGFYVDTLDVLETGFIHDLQVSLDIQDTNVSNLSVYLQNQDSGAFLTLLDEPRSRLDNVTMRLADGASDDAVTNVAFNGEVGQEAFPLATYRPVEPLEYLVGKEIAGQWELTILNLGEEETGIPPAANSVLRSWSITARIGDEAPAPALVFNPRIRNPRALGRGYDETVVVSLTRAGAGIGEIEVKADAGELSAAPSSLQEGFRRTALLFPVPETAELGAREVVISAQSGPVSRILSYDASVAQPQSSGMELLSHVPLPTLGSIGGSGNDIWGWTDPLDGKEIAIVGTSVGTAFVDLSSPTEPLVLGILPTETRASTWRDIKVYSDHAYIVSEAQGHGMQIFDLTQLRGVTQTQDLVPTAHIAVFGNAHNIAINEETGTAFVVGSDYEGCDGGILVFDLSILLAPVAISCFSGALTNNQPGGPSYPTDVYTHDVQCVSYHGPDQDYQGKEICVSSDESTLGIADFSNPSSPKQIVRKSYDAVGYAHQGWLTEDHQFFILNDEFDEVDLDLPTRSYVWDLRDLDKPEIIGVIDNPSIAVGHNTYIADDIAYQANYTSGIRLVDVSDLAAGNTPETAFYDTYPDDDAICTASGQCGIRSFDGAWSNYPFFDSGVIVVSDIQRGLFVLGRSN